MRLLTENELCNVLKVGRVFVYRCRKQGLPFIRLGDKSLRYNLDDVLQWFIVQNDKLR